jgi:hypothetical protein
MDNSNSLGQPEEIAPQVLTRMLIRNALKCKHLRLKCPFPIFDFDPMACYTKECRFNCVDGSAIDGAGDFARGRLDVT